MTPQSDPNRRLETVLSAVSRLLERTYNEESRKLGLTQNQGATLLQVAWGESFTQTEIANLLGIGKAAAGALILDLEKRGLLRRSRHADDGRAMKVTLTAAGRRTVEKINDFGADFGPALRAGIDRDDLRTAMAVLTQLRENLEAMHGVTRQRRSRVDG